VFNRQYRWPVRGSARSDKKEAGILDRTVKERRSGVSLTRDNEEGRNRNGIKSIIRLANDLQAGTGYKGTTKRTGDRDSELKLQ